MEPESLFGLGSCLWEDRNILPRRTTGKKKGCEKNADCEVYEQGRCVPLSGDSQAESVFGADVFCNDTSVR